MHDTDIELAAGLFGEGDQIAPRRPDRCCIIATLEANPLNVGAILIHGIELRTPSPVRIKYDPLSVR